MQSDPPGRHGPVGGALGESLSRPRGRCPKFQQYWEVRLDLDFLIPTGASR
jgi:hypothetical protein